MTSRCGSLTTIGFPVTLILPLTTQLLLPGSRIESNGIHRDAAAWNASIAGVRRDCRALQKLAADTRIDLFAQIPHGSGQTYLREILLVADHTAYHVGQIVAVRRSLGIWE